MTSPTKTTSNLYMGCKQVLKEVRLEELITVSVGVQVGEKDEEFRPTSPQ